MSKKKEGKLDKLVKEQPQDKTRELTDSLQRLQAEFENYKKRTEKEKLELTKYVEKNFTGDLLNIIDNFELALKNKCCNQEDFIKGMELIYAQLFELLEKKGLKSINTLNQKFDPYKHEAMMQEESNLEPGTITEELQKGYTYNEKVLRHSKVKVSKGCNK